MKIVNHKVDGASYVPTKKKGGTITPKIILMHFTAGWTTEGDVATLATSDRKASAHGVLGRDGTWVQIVPFNVKAWHAGPSRYPLNSNRPISDNLNDDAIGIEISNIGYLEVLSNGMFKDEYGSMITGDGIFIGSKRKTPKESPPPRVWPEHTHPVLSRGKRYVWEPFTEAQLQALDDLVLALLAKYPTIQYITGHEFVDRRGWKSDPGPMFPMARYQRMLETHADPDDLADQREASIAHLTSPDGKLLPGVAEEAVRKVLLTPVVKPPVVAPPPLPAPWYRRWNLIWR